MSIAKTLSPHIPYLRRIARTLSGSQAGADAYAVATLEAILADPSSLDTTFDARAALYRVFLALWCSIRLNVESQGEAKTDLAETADRHLGAITPRPRVAFLRQ